MEIQVIFVLENNRPIIDQYQFHPQYLGDEDIFKKFLLSKLPIQYHDELQKAKCQLFSDSDMEKLTVKIPQWYKDCNGSIWFKPKPVSYIVDENGNTVAK